MSDFGEEINRAEGNRQPRTQGQAAALNRSSGCYIPQQQPMSSKTPTSDLENSPASVKIDAEGLGTDPETGPRRLVKNRIAKGSNGPVGGE